MDGSPGPGRSCYTWNSRLLHQSRPWAQQVTASVLYLLRQEGYTQYCDALDDGQVTMSVEDGCATRADTSTQFKFWSIILKLELEIMI